MANLVKLVYIQYNEWQKCIYQSASSFAKRDFNSVHRDGKKHTSFFDAFYLELVLEKNEHVLSLQTRKYLNSLQKTTQYFDSKISAHMQWLKILSNIAQIYEQHFWVVKLHICLILCMS